jgi:peptidoglycan/LPS O-acetylase OafA/YrhL
MQVIAAAILLLTFSVTAWTRRDRIKTALAIGSVPAILVAAASPASLLRPLGWTYLVSIWLPFLIAALAGAWLSKLATTGRRRRRVRR